MSYYQKLIELTKRPFRKPPRRKRVCPECGSSGGMAYPNRPYCSYRCKEKARIKRIPASERWPANKRWDVC